MTVHSRQRRRGVLPYVHGSGDVDTRRWIGPIGGAGAAFGVMLFATGALAQNAGGTGGTGTGLRLPDGGSTSDLTTPGGGGVAGTGLGGSTTGGSGPSKHGVAGAGTAPGSGGSVSGPAGQGIDGQGGSGTGSRSGAGTGQ